MNVTINESSYRIFTQKSSKSQWRLRISLLIIDFLIFIITFNIIKPINLVLGKGWPPIKMYYHHLPDEFNKDILKQIGWKVYNEKSARFQFALEHEFTNLIQRTPLITKNIDEADFIYVDFYPTYQIEAQIKRPERFKVMLDYLDYMNKTGLMQRSNIFMVRTFPWNDIGFRYLFGYSACYELSRPPKEIIVPYYSKFPDYPATLDKILNKRKYFIYYVGSNRRQRERMVNSLQNLSDSYIKVFRRYRRENAEELKKLPKMMSQSKYCLVPKGDTPSSKRFYDAIIYGCIPVVISDHFQPAFDKTLIDWSKCTVRIPQRKILNIEKTLRRISDKKYKEMFYYLLDIRNLIRFDVEPNHDTGIGSMMWELYFLRERIKEKNFEIHRRQIQKILNMNRTNPFG